MILSNAQVYSTPMVKQELFPREHFGHDKDLFQTLYNLSCLVQWVYHILHNLSCVVQYTKCIPQHQFLYSPPPPCPNSFNESFVLILLRLFQRYFDFRDILASWLKLITVELKMKVFGLILDHFICFLSNVWLLFWNRKDKNYKDRIMFDWRERHKNKFVFKIILKWICVLSK